MITTRIPHRGEAVVYRVPAGRARGELRRALITRAHADWPNTAVDLAVAFLPTDGIREPWERYCVHYGPEPGGYTWPQDHPEAALPQDHPAGPIARAHALLAQTLTEGRADDGSLPPHARAGDLPAAPQGALPGDGADRPPDRVLGSSDGDEAE